MNASLFICVPCRERVLALGYTHPLVAISSLVVIGHAHHPPPHAYLEHKEWRKVWMHAFSAAGVRPADDFHAVREVEAIESEFFRDIIDGRPELRRFRPESAEEIRTAVRASYVQHLEDATEREAPGLPLDDSVVYAPALGGAFLTHYVPHMRGGSDALAVLAILHVLPLVALESGDALDALAEYILWRESGSSPRLEWLGQMLLRGHVRLTESDLLSRMFNPEVGDLVEEAQRLELDWVQLLDQYLNPSSAVAEDESDLTSEEAQALLEKMEQAVLVPSGAYPLPEEIEQAATAKWAEVMGPADETRAAREEFLGSLRAKWLLICNAREAGTSPEIESEDDLGWQYDLQGGSSPGHLSARCREAWIAGIREMETIVLGG